MQIIKITFSQLNCRIINIQEIFQIIKPLLGVVKTFCSRRQKSKKKNKQVRRNLLYENKDIENIWSGLISLFEWHINLYELFNAKAILVEE